MFATAALATAGSNYFPISAGNQWVYRDVASGQTKTIDVMIPIMHGGKVYNKVTGYGVQPMYLRQAENGNIFQLDEENDREVLVTGFEFVPGGWYDSGLSECEQLAQPQPKEIAYRGPIGPEIPVLQVQYKSFGCADAGITEELYAQNIGLIQRTVTTIAGPRRFELVYARVGSVTYEGERGTSFRVLLDRNWIEQKPDKSADTLRVTMRVSLQTAPWMELQFDPGAQYDIRVRDDKGNIVYQWSEDAMPARTASNKVVVSRDTDFVQEIPVHGRGGQALKGGYYTVEAWLNTPERQFAGATRFFYAPAE